MGWIIAILIGLFLVPTGAGIIIIICAIIGLIASRR